MTHKSKEEQQKLLQLLKQAVGNDIPQLTDEYFLQFLVANAWDVHGAQRQLQETLAWRKENDIDSIPVATNSNKLPLLLSVRGYKYVQDGDLGVHPGLSTTTLKIGSLIGGDCFHKFDKEGHPILIDRTGYHNSKALGNELTSEQITNYQVACQEFVGRVIMKESSERLQRIIHRETVIFDCSNMGIRQFHMNALYHLKAVADIVQHYYPETLHRLFIINAPSAFVMMWKVIRPWLNPGTLDKVQILGKDFKNVLLEHIDAENLPDFLGGTCTCDQMPGGCVPIRSEGSLLNPTDANEQVSTVYNTDIMEAASTNRSLCQL
ncbi:CRAL-TRIO domain-containing protein [Radiomyces spectabilis]|uniref:CRAL-TRIO domain-containing protein n=1 Tax=Radiomyces spectabilis TaxID=64574 RepID=UPI00221F3BC5|nr:CRAL-TRIO domain-containing protein [Radiomyces spectabilis]KAI8374128.1 CRAL-TRIO domain-containing protein [Radiomyces spectabilis]